MKPKLPFPCKVKDCKGEINKGVFAHRIRLVCNKCGAVYYSDGELYIWSDATGTHGNPRQGKS